MTVAPLLFFVAGEPSGDLLGARLMEGLHALRPELRFAGIGGERMTEAGLHSQFPMSDLTLFGLAEIAPKLPLLVRRLRETVAAVERLQPDVLVTVDAPDFCFRVARRLQGRVWPDGRRLKLVHYVAPTVWAWRPGRARKIAGFLDHLLALFPFEPPYFEREGLDCSFVGHPLVDSGADKGDGARLRAELGLGDAVPLLCVLPGSRTSELARLVPVIEDTLEKLRAAIPDLQVVVPAVARHVHGLALAAERWALPTHVVEGDRAKYDAMAACGAAIAASGTVSLELALAGLPSTTIYKLHPLTVLLYKPLIRVKFANLVNIMQNRMAVPELLQEKLTAEALTESTLHLLRDPEARRAQQAALAEVADWLGAGGIPPARRAAEAVLGVLDAA